MTPNTPATLIAEIGCNHMGDLETAKRFIEVADTFCGVRHVKFQKRDAVTLLSDEQYNAPHPVPENSFGETYGEHREFLEFGIAEHRELQADCAERGMVYSCSVWDVPSLESMADLNPPMIKVPSATNTNLALLERACEIHRGQIHVSLGMTTHDEELAILDVFRTARRTGDLVLYSCTSGYPIEAGDAYLLDIPRLLEDYGDEVAAVGFSGHHKGISLDVAAFTLGATFVERHFTLDRTWKGTDHAASLEPDGLRRLERNLEETAQALRQRPAGILGIEKPQRAKLKWRGD